MGKVYTFKNPLSHNFPALCIESLQLNMDDYIHISIYVHTHIVSYIYYHIHMLFISRIQCLHSKEAISSPEHHH